MPACPPLCAPEALSLHISGCPCACAHVCQMSADVGKELWEGIGRLMGAGSPEGEWGHGVYAYQALLTTVG